MLSTGEEIALYGVLSALAIGILVTIPWFYTQLIVWKEEGHDHVLLVGNIVITLLLWLVLIGGSVYTMRIAKRASQTEQGFFNRQYEHRTAMEKTIRDLVSDIEASKSEASAKDVLASALQTKLDKLGYRYNHDMGKQNEDYRQLRDSLMAQLAEARAGTAPCRNTDTEVILECAMMGAEGMRPTDITSLVRSKFLSQGKPIPVQWQDYLPEDPSPRNTKFVTATFSITKRETNFINFLAEPPLKTSAEEGL